MTNAHHDPRRRRRAELERHARTRQPQHPRRWPRKVLRGETTIEEVLRVTRED
jgi:hypothetical protein